MKSRTHCALIAFALLFFARADVFALGGDLQGLDKANSTNFNAASPWTGGNLQDWGELDYVPCRVQLTGGPGTNQTVTIIFPKFKSGVPGFQNLYFLSNSANLQIMSGPTLSSPPAPADWSYTMNVTVTNSATAYIYFFTRLAAGSHLNVGSSLQLGGEPSFSPLQIHKPGPGPGLPDLAITKTGPSNANPGQVITYTITYTNKSATDAATGAQISDRLPSLVSFVSASNGGTNEGGTLSFDLGTVPARGSGIRTYQVMLTTNATTGQTFTNDALILSAEDDNSLADNRASWVVRVVQNRAPVAAPDSYGVNEDTRLSINAPGVLANDTDPDGNSLTANLVSTVSNGTLTLTNNGGFVYFPNTNFFGTDSFVYRAFDGTNFSSNVTVTITVTNVNDRPIANPDTYGINEDTTLVVNPPGVLSNDTDADGNSLTTVIVTPPATGTFNSNSDGSFTYLPPTNFSGQITFTYSATDGSLTSAPVVVTINVTNLNDAPIANPDSYTMAEDTTLTISSPGVLGNDTDADGNPITAVLVTPPPSGTLNLNANGGFTYTPPANYFGTVTFTYAATDGSLTSAPVNVTITVTNVNDSPFVNITSPTNGNVFGAPATVTVTAEAGDIDGVVTNVNLYSGTNVIGTFTNGPFTVTLTNLLPGIYTFTATATDDGGVTTTSTPVSITVTGAPPTLVCATNRSVELGTSWTFDEPSVTGTCGTNFVQVVGTVTNAGCGNSFTATRTWRVTDECGNQVECSQTIAVVDTTAPNLVCAGNKTVELGAAWNFDEPSASDLGGAVTIAVIGTVTNAGPCGNAYTATRTWSATDPCGNSNTCSQLVTVRDTTPPNIQCAEGKTVELGSTWTFDGPTATDLSGATIAVINTVTNAGSCGAGFVATRTWSATDPCGNSNVCSQVVTVRDTTPPAIVCATNKSVELGAAWNFDEPTASDLSGYTIALINTVTNSGSCGAGYVAARTWSATDPCGNSNTCSQVVTVGDSTGPSITCATNKTVELGAAWSFDEPTASDLSAVTISIVGTTTNRTESCGNGYVAIRTWSASDACGNSNTCSQVVTVVDTTAPTMVCATNKTVELGTEWNFDAPAVTDLSSNTVSVLSTVTNSTCGAAFTATRVWVAVDACGNSNTCSQTVSVVDTTAPAIVCAQNKTVELGAAWNFDEPTASDLSGFTIAVINTVTNTAQSCGAGFVATRTWSATDPCGNSNTCSQVVTVRDTTPPEISCGTNKTVELGTEWSFDQPGTTDLSSHAISIVSTVTNATCGASFTATRVWAAIDTCGNSNGCSQTVSVVDTTAPAIVCASNKVVELGTVWNFDEPTATDLSSFTIAVINTVTNTAESCGGGYVAIRTWSATDACGNSNTCSQVVSVVDTKAPSLECAEGKTVELGTAWNFDAPNATDFSSNTVSVLTTGTNATCGAAFTATRVWVAVDACGNSNTCSQTVSVVDTTPPTLVCATNKTVELGNEWSFDEPSATDLSGVTIGVINSVTNAGSCGIGYIATRTWSATDACGNSNTCSQIVTVVDTTPPSIVCAGNKTVELGAEWDFDAPSFSDLNSPVLSVLSTVTNITCGSAYTATRTWVATDACGNTNTCSQVVTVRDTTPPVITCAQPKTLQAGVEWTFDTPTATDLSSTTISIVGTVTNFTCGGSFTATRTWRATDGCENSSECSQTVTVVDNAGPSVTIISPTNNAAYVTPATFTLIASASDPGTVATVKFFNGTNLLATLSNAPYFFVWSNAPVGTNKLTAVAADTCGNISTSTVVNVRLATNAFNVAGPIQLNPQNGRWEQVVNVTNTTGDTWLNGFRISITTTSRVENVTGTNNGVKYIDYPISLAPGAGTQVIIRYIQGATRPTATLQVTPLPYPRPPLVAPVILQPQNGLPQVDVAFNSLANRYYFLEHSSDFKSWTTEPAPVLGTGGVVKWQVNKNIEYRFFRVVVVP